MNLNLLATAADIAANEIHGTKDPEDSTTFGAALLPQTSVSPQDNHSVQPSHVRPRLIPHLTDSHRSELHRHRLASEPQPPLMKPHIKQQYDHALLLRRVGRLEVEIGIMKGKLQSVAVGVPNGSLPGQITQQIPMPHLTELQKTRVPDGDTRPNGTFTSPQLRRALQSTTANRPHFVVCKNLAPSTDNVTVQEWFKTCDVLSTAVSSDIVGEDRQAKRLARIVIDLSTTSSWIEAVLRRLEAKSCSEDSSVFQVVSEKVFLQVWYEAEAWMTCERLRPDLLHRSMAGRDVDDRRVMKRRRSGNDSRV